MSPARQRVIGALIVLFAVALVVVPRVLTVEEHDSKTRHCVPLAGEKLYRIYARNLDCQDRGYELVRTVMRHPTCMERLECTLGALEYECEGEVREAGNRRMVCRRPELGKKFRFVFSPRAKRGTPEEEIPGAQDLEEAEEEEED